jgi:hypothetical protein
LYDSNFNLYVKETEATAGCFDNALFCDAYLQEACFESKYTVPCHTRDEEAYITKLPLG